MPVDRPDQPQTVNDLAPHFRVRFFREPGDECRESGRALRVRLEAQHTGGAEPHELVAVRQARDKVRGRVHLPLNAAREGVSGTNRHTHSSKSTNGQSLLGQIRGREKPRDVRRGVDKNAPGEFAVL